MKKYVFLAVIVFLSTAFSMCVYADITPKEPGRLGGGVYDIASAENLYWFVQYCNSAESTDDVCARLTNDISLNDGKVTANSTNVNVWEPIINFNGKFWGDGHTISGIYVKDKEYAGLFGSTGSKAHIDEIVIDNSYIEGTKYVGAVVGYNKSEFLYRCINKGTVTSYTDGACTGGIVGYSDNGIGFSLCSNYGDITGTEYTGGIAGAIDYTENKMTEFENYGNISGKKYAGGVVGYFMCNKNRSIIKQSLNMGKVSAIEKAGGIVGFSDYYITQSSNGNIAMIGFFSNNIESSYSVGELSAETTYGIAGHSYGNVNIIDSCYLEGTATDKTQLLEFGIGFAKPQTRTLCTELSLQEFASGKATYILNENSTPLNGPWYQNINSDPYPLADNTHGLVYRNIITGEYSNTEDNLHKACRTLGNTDKNNSVDICDVIQILKKADSADYIMPVENDTTSDVDGLYGDINGDGIVTDADAKLLLDVISKNKIDMNVGVYVFKA